MTNSCFNCKHAKFQMTSHSTPRIKGNKAGTCDLPAPPKPALPLCFEFDYWPPSKRAIWPDDRRECPAWEAK